jgi:hypothetical protein
MEQQEIVILGSDGTEHVFPAGMDPQKAAAIVRQHEGGASAATPVGKNEPGMGTDPIANMINRVSPGTGDFLEGAGQGFRDYTSGVVKGFSKNVIPGVIEGAKQTIRLPYTLTKAGVDTVKGAYNFSQDPAGTTHDAVGAMSTIPGKIRDGVSAAIDKGVRDPEGYGGDMGSLYGTAVAGMGAAKAVPLLPKPIARTVGAAVEKVGNKAALASQIVGAHQVASGNPMGLVSIGLPVVLSKSGQKLQEFGADPEAEAAAMLERSGARNIDTGPVKDLGIRLAPPAPGGPITSQRVPYGHGEPPPITNADRIDGAFNAARLPGGELERLVAKADRPVVRPTGKAATDLAEGRTVNTAPPVGPKSTLQDLARKNGTGIDQEADLAAQQLAAENERRLTNRNSRVPVSEGIPASKSKSAMSATPGLTRNDLSEVGLNPDLNYKNLTPDMLEKIRTNRAARHMTNYGNAQADKAVRKMQDAVPMTHVGTFEQALLDRLR